MLQNSLNRARSLRRDDGGFTLIELLIVILILGVLAGIVVFSVKGIANHGEQAACRTEVKTVDTAIEAYYAEKSAYPSAIDDATHTATTLVGAGFLHSGDTNYVSGLTAAGDRVTLAGAPAGCTA